MVEAVQDTTSLVDFVKSQVSFHERLAEVHSKNIKRAEKHRETAAKFSKLLKYIDELESRANENKLLSRPQAHALSLSFDEIEDLPPELLHELSVSDGDRTDFTIMRILEGVGGIASLDRLLVGLYRETGEVMKRSTLTSRVYRMSQKGLLYAVPNKKGVYSMKEMTEEDVDRIFG
jgi:hypothetical protein